MIELENAQIESVELASETYGKYEASPLPAGYGVTLGNALRRVLLSSLDGRGRDVRPDPRCAPRVQHHPRRQGRRHRDAAEPQATPPQELRVAPDAAEAPQVGRRSRHRGRHQRVRRRRDRQLRPAPPHARGRRRDRDGPHGGARRRLSRGRGDQGGCPSGSFPSMPSSRPSDGSTTTSRTPASGR